MQVINRETITRYGGIDLTVLTIEAVLSLLLGTATSYGIMLFIICAIIFIYNMSKRRIKTGSESGIIIVGGALYTIMHFLPTVPEALPLGFLLFGAILTALKVVRET